MNKRKLTPKQIAEYYEVNDFSADYHDAKSKGTLLVSKGDGQGFASEKKMLTLRVSAKDLMAIREKANRAGMPYQTLIGSILHRYANGLIELKEAV